MFRVGHKGKLTLIGEDVCGGVVLSERESGLVLARLLALSCLLKRMVMH